MRRVRAAGRGRGKAVGMVQNRHAR
jgi:hypothetical protein